MKDNGVFDVCRIAQVFMTKCFCAVFHINKNDVALHFLKRKGFQFIDLIDNNNIIEQLNQGKPLFMGRMGNTEAAIVKEYLQKRNHVRSHYSQQMLWWLLSTSGFFLNNKDAVEEEVDEFARLLISCFPYCDYMASNWPPVQTMVHIYLKYLRHTGILRNSNREFADLGPYCNVPTEKTWVSTLAGKKVLVVSSFPDSIRQQYLQKDKIAYNADCVLPDFELITYKTFSTQFGEKPDGYDTFYQVLQKMTDDIAQMDFDIALVGAGAYGFPLSANIKKMGKQVIEPCGNTSLFFGVYGERQLSDTYKKYINENWIRPVEEPPKRYKEIENGCYW